MRKLLSYDTEHQATKLQALLTVNHIETRCQSAAEQWDIWIIDEDQLEPARSLAQQFNENPDADEYRTVLDRAQKISAAADKQQRVRQKQARRVEVRQQWSQTRPTRSITRSMIILCSVLFGATLVFSPGQDNLVNQALGIVRHASVNEAYIQRIEETRTAGHGSQQEAKNHIDLALRESYNTLLLEDLKRGQLWRAVTPIFLHGGGGSTVGLSDFLHILFNMYWLYVLGLLLETRFGPKTFILLVLFTGILSILMPAVSPTDGILGISGLRGGPVVGFSGVIYGFIGFGWIKMKLQPAIGVLIPPFILIFMLIWLAIGFISPASDSSLFGNISHLAHAAGLLAGVAFGFLHTRPDKQG